MDVSRPDGQLIFLSLTNDIFGADETELDRLIEEMTERNMRAMTRKMGMNLG